MVQTVVMACVSPALWSLAEQWSTQLGWADSLYTTTSLFLVFGAVIDEVFSRYHAGGLSIQLLLLPCCCCWGWCCAGR